MTALRFFLGDDNGQVKSIECSQKANNEWEMEARLLNDGGRAGKSEGIQQLVLYDDQIVIAKADGYISTLPFPSNNGPTEFAKEWREDRFVPGNRFVGLGVTPVGHVISCTNGGNLRLYDIRKDQGPAHSITAIPGRLCDWILSEDGAHFAYGGEEVEVSLWDTARAFETSRVLQRPATFGLKRKKVELIDGEVWRAKNVSNDFLNLRQPVHNTCLTFFPPISTSNQTHNILSGTRLGSVRRYDTRAAKKPVADWKGIAKLGVKNIQRGSFEYDAFVADYGSNLTAIDVRTGKVLYTYNGIAGAISSMASTSASPLLISTALDRYVRLHSTPFKGRGETVAKLWIKSVAQCIAWDHSDAAIKHLDRQQGIDDDEFWEGIPSVQDREADEEIVKHRDKKRKRAE